MTGRRGSPHGGGQEADEALGDAPGGVLGVQVGGMAEGAGDAGRPAVGVVPLGEVEGEVEVSGGSAERQHIDLQAGESGAAPVNFCEASITWNSGWRAA